MNTKDQRLVDSMARVNIAQSAIVQIISDSAQYVSPELRKRLHQAMETCSDFRSEAKSQLDKKDL